MYGLKTRTGERFKTKKSVKEVLSTPDQIRLEATSIHGNEFDGLLSEAPNGTYTFVGPDPYNARNWYGNLIKTGSSIKLK